jgi:NAD(P)-dependent dehydrogenase (short-subunit alcohol dehydrogenase family)
MDLRGARTLVTGATGGLGAAIARACAARGAQVIVTGRREESLRALAAELGADSVAADLASRDGLAHLIDAVGELDVLVSNAALPGGGRVETFSTEEIDRVLDVNLRVPVLLSRHFTPTMVKRAAATSFSSHRSPPPSPHPACRSTTRPSPLWSATACHYVVSWRLLASASRSCTQGRFETRACGPTPDWRRRSASVRGPPMRSVLVSSGPSNAIAPRSWSLHSRYELVHSLAAVPLRRS